MYGIKNDSGEKGKSVHGGTLYTFNFQYEVHCMFFFPFILKFPTRLAFLCGVAAARYTAVGVPPAQVPFAMQIQ